MTDKFDVVKVLKMDVAFRGDAANIVNTLADGAHQTSRAKGFYDGDINIGEKIALIHEEVSEALSAIRAADPDAPDKHVPQYSNFAAELADVVIRVLDLAAYKNIPLGDVIVAKMIYNAGRPHKHGKAF